MIIQRIWTKRGTGLELDEFNLGHTPGYLSEKNKFGGSVYRSRDGRKNLTTWDRE